MIGPCFRMKQSFKILSPYHILYYTKHKFEIKVIFKHPSKPSLSYCTKLIIKSYKWLSSIPHEVLASQEAFSKVHQSMTSLMPTKIAWRSPYDLWLWYKFNAQSFASKLIIDTLENLCFLVINLIRMWSFDGREREIASSLQNKLRNCFIRHKHGRVVLQEATK